MIKFRSVMAASATALMWASAAFAQEAGPAIDGASDAEEKPAPEIVVTGSRIARRDFVSASPIVTTSEQAIQNTGLINLEGAINQLPQFVPAQGASTNALQGGGRATLNLRGLGEQRNLVLLNGRRLPVSNALNVVDINILPNAAIGNVEVISGGASAVYGSDAMSGVVNFKTRTNFSGLQIDGQTGTSFEGGATQSSISLMAGSKFADGRGHAMFTFGVTDRKELVGSARDFYSQGVASGNLASGLVNWSGNAPSQAAMNALFARYGFAAGTVGRTSNVGFNNGNTLFAINGGANLQLPSGQYGLVANTVSQFTAQDNTIVVPQRRYNMFAQLDYELTPDVTVYMQGLYSNSFSTMATGYTLTLPSVTIPVTNPFIPADLATLLASRTNRTAPMVFQKRFEEAGKRYIDEQFDTFQILVGAKGQIGNGWTWDIYASHDQTTNNERLTVGVRQSRIQALLDAPDGGRSICEGGYNPFGISASANISPACLAYIRTEVKNLTKVDQDVIEATLGGGLFQLPAGEVRFSLTGTHRENGYSYSPDSLLVPVSLTSTTNDVFATGSSRPTTGATNVSEVGMELLVPLLKDTTFAQSLNLSLGYRYSSYNITGGVSTFKAEVDWKPINSLLIRGGYERATRAPNIGELFSALTRSASQLGFAPGAGDPCDNRFIGRTAQVRTLCLATGISPALIDSFVFGSSAVGANVNGNLALKPETADTFTLGTVWSPRFSSPLFRRLSLSVDYYNIKIANAIGTVPGNTTVNKCYNLDGSNPTYDPANQFCQVIRREPSTGLITDVFTPFLNIGGFKTSGIDFQLDWAADLDGLGLSGELSLSSVVNYLNKFEIMTLPGTPFQDFAGTIGALPLPRWRSNTTLAYSNGPATIGMRWRHLANMAHETAVTRPASPAEPSPAYNIFDLNARVAVSKAIELRGGINNLFDKEPPLLAGVPGATNPGLYDVVGRSFFIGARFTF